MRSLLTFGILTLLTLSSCSPKNENPRTHTFPGPPPVKLLDADRDGLSDPLEKQMGTNPYVATFPSFALSGRVHTKLELSHKSIEATPLKMETSGKQQVSLTRTERTEMAKMGFQKDFKFNDVTEEIKVSPLPSYRLTQIMPYQWFSLNQYNLSENPTLSFQTELPLKLTNFDGTVEVKDVIARIGFYDHAEFVTLVNRLILKDQTGKSIKLGQKKSEEVAFLDFTIESNDSIKRFLRTKNPLIIQIIDYESKTSEKNSFKFSEQWDYALQKQKPFVISLPEEDQIYLVDRELNFNEALTQITKDYSLNSHRDVQSYDRFTNETTVNLSLKEMNSLQLQERKWYQFSQDKVFAMAYLSNLELAQAGQELVSKSSFKFEENQMMKEIGKVRLGETIKIKFKGSFQTASVTNVQEHGSVSYTAYRTEILSRGCVYNCHGDRGLEPADSIRVEVPKQTECIQTKSEPEWTTHPIKSGSLIFLQTRTKDKVALSDLFEVTQSKTVFHKESSEYEIEFTINENFINTYGDDLAIRIPDFQDHTPFTVGIIDLQCAQKLPRDFDYHSHFGSKELKTFEQQNNIEVIVTKRF